MASGRGADPGPGTPPRPRRHPRRRSCRRPRPRASWRVLRAVDPRHEAVSQVANYLTAFDEDRNAIRGRYGIESRRASGTVVIGHPGFQPQFSEQEIAETLRTYNAEHARISVVTYKELLDNAERSLTFADNGD